MCVPLPKGRPATRVIDIVAMKPNQNLVTGRYEEIKSTISDAGVRRVNRKTSPTRIIEMASKASRGIEISNQVITDYYLNVNGATIQSTGQKIKPNAQEMHWSVWKFKNRTDKTGTRVGGVIPIIDPTQTKDMIINNLP